MVKLSQPPRPGVCKNEKEIWQGNTTDSFIWTRGESKDEGAGGGGRETGRGNGDLCCIHLDCSCLRCRMWSVVHRRFLRAGFLPLGSHERRNPCVVEPFSRRTRLFGYFEVQQLFRKDNHKQ